MTLEYERKKVSKYIRLVQETYKNICVYTRIKIKLSKHQYYQLVAFGIAVKMRRATVTIQFSMDFLHLMT